MLKRKGGEFVVSDDKMMIKKHSAMIQTNVKELTLTQRKMINYLVLIAQKTGKRELYQTTISNIRESCNIGKTENIDLKEQLRKLSDIKIEFNYLNKDKNEVWQIMSLLSSAEVVQNTGIVEFEFSVKLLEKVLNPSIYAPLSVSLISGLKSSYSIVLYEFLRDYVGSPLVPRLEIDEFKNLMGIKGSEYRLFNDFKKRVLDIAAKEVNEKTDIYCEYKLVKERGNRYSHIQFTVIKRDMQLMLGYESIVENPKDDISKEIPQEIIDTLPEKHRTKAIFELIIKYLFDKGTIYVISNLRYALRKAKNNFSGYLSQALKKDYASHDREVEAKLKSKTEKMIRHKAESEKNAADQRKRTEEALNIIRDLPEKDQEQLRKRALVIAKTESPNNEFALRDSVIELKMAKLYISDRNPNGYSSSDID